VGKGTWRHVVGDEGQEEVLAEEFSQVEHDATVKPATGSLSFHS
jgi:hypothetical protein